MKILISKGHLIDKENALDKIADILIEDDKIVKISENIDEYVEEEHTINADGCIVVPGLIDNHTHLYPFIKKGIPAESVCFSSGVTTVVDAGSLGCDNYEDVRNFLKYSRLTIKAYLNISSEGLAKLPEVEDLEPKNFKTEKIKNLLKKYPDELIGLKIRVSKNIVKEKGYESLKEAVKIAREAMVPIMVHSTNPPDSLDKMVNILNRGDIVTHMYQKSPFTILKNNKIYDAVLEARKRGVLFEAADARAHFSFEIAENALKENFYPDIIATDLTAFSMYQRPTAFNLLNQIAKYEYLGLSFSDIIKSCTTVPAKILGLSKNIGALKEGYQADIAIIKKENINVEFGDRPYSDMGKNIRKGKFIYNSMLTIKNGEIVYRNILF
ncbi:MAG: amidohydrolase family protein [Fusobacterium gastrosuis]|uniref:amidohydrolase family protein n=1 Tax=Fusobacterium gastrosuis TaxID=1755100 RepID=UPI002A8C1B98|nr:amidohydrolase family protein [Fusobacterium gastrosuis]